LASDRIARLKQGEKYLRQGRLDAAITEYVQVVEGDPRDWSTANLLGDLYVRAQQADKALPLYARIADHLDREGFYPKASVLYKKILKLRPDDETTQLTLADLSARQGHLGDAKTYLLAIGARRRERGDRDGAAEVALRLAELDPGDVETRLGAARTLEEMGRPADAAGHFRALHADLLARGASAGALDALRDAVRLNPGDTEGRRILARAAVDAGDVLGAQTYLDRETAGTDPSLLTALLEVFLRTGRTDEARALLVELLAMDPQIEVPILETAWLFVDSDTDAAYLCVDAVVGTAVDGARFEEAARHLQAFVERRSHHVPALLRLVDVCVDGDLTTLLAGAQVQLADGYLEHGQAAEARVIAEDLLAGDPDTGAHAERLRRALVLLDTDDPDSVIADRLASLRESEALDFSDLSSGPDAVAPMPAPVEPLRAAAPALADPSPAPEPTPVQKLGAMPGPVSDHDQLEVAAIPPAADAVAEAETAPAVEEQSIDPPPAVEPEPSPVAVLEPVTRIPVSPPAPEPLSADEDEGAADDLDLTSLLGGLGLEEREAASAPPDEDDELDRFFADQRASAVEQSEDDEFAAQYMKLAHTYLDMGMDDEAISSLQTAVRSARYRFEAAALLGRLYKRRGQTGSALEWLERAADAPAPTVQDGRALLYDLGVMLDSVGETPRALAVFLELQTDAGDYRDVPARIDRLARVQSGG
jgi:tetratricopeptide (TPR) repeat protein